MAPAPHNTMPMRTVLAVVLALVLLQPTLAGAQRERTVGRFVVRGTPAAEVRLLPLGDDPAGELTWWCIGRITVLLGPVDSVSPAPVSYVIWRFDDAAPDTSFLIRGRLRESERMRFTARSREAARLQVRLLGGDPAAEGTEFHYDLSRGAQALGALPCAASASAAAPVRSWPPPEGLVPNPPDSVLRPARPAPRTTPDGPYEMTAVEEMPVAINGPELLRELRLSYPPPLRDAGVTGIVNVRFLVLQDGRVAPGSATIIESTHERFNEPVLRKLPILHFRPARVNGRPVRVWVVQPIHFSLGA